VRAQSAVLGVAAAAALSGTAAALPCAVTVPTEVSGRGCSLTEARSIQADGAQQPERKSEPPAAQPEVLFEAVEAHIIEDTEVFTGHGIKITNLPATMTSNKYVASRLPLAARRPIDDLITLSPDYLTVKTLAPLPKRSPVGVGLVTVPKPPPKESDKIPEVPGLQPTRP
jgi:hypothetical protein